MTNNFNTDWYNKLKLEVIDLVFLFKQIKEDIVFLLLTNQWILEDVNLFESFAHLTEMIDHSNYDIESFIDRLGLLEENSVLFDSGDLLDEFEFVRENIRLEASFFMNMVDYITIVDDYTINDIEIKERLEKYQEIDVFCYNQMKINQENLKQLKKERRDYFE